MASMQDNPDDKIIRMDKDYYISPDLVELDETTQNQKRAFWVENITKIKAIVAPMVDQSELAFRMMLRQYCSDLCYSPMIHAHLFATSPGYRNQAFSTCLGDRPLIIQFCANNADDLLTSCRLVEGLCDGVDLNLGCPQIIAKKGHYGSYLQEEPELIKEMVSKVYRYCKLPLSVKIRRLGTDEETIAYAKMLEQAGATMLTLHGRTREMRGTATGVADWEIIKKIKKVLSIPVIANGNIQFPYDLDDCLKQTNADAVMSAEGILSNPYLLANKSDYNFKIAKEYLSYAKKFESSVCAIRAHIFKICHYSLLEYVSLRDGVATAKTIQHFYRIIDELENNIRRDNATVDFDNPDWQPSRDNQITKFHERVYNLPHYIAKPYTRPAIDDSKLASTEFRVQRRGHLSKLAEETGLSVRFIRKIEKRKMKMPGLDPQYQAKKQYQTCVICKSPAGESCNHDLCKKCCKSKCATEDLLCTMHYKGRPC
uniref:Dus domain-containing protein n=1 Tax=Rhabditophanes sp. KR3021 TaxID=114890 RepID=A0AC35TSP6_9BILA